MEKIYRDSVHNIIRLETDSAEGRLLARLVDTKEFQRLRRIRQLGLAMFAYQGAEHSRFTHSLGAMHLATRILDRLSAKYPITDESRIAVRAAALLHDIGHGPFSHVIEPIFKFHHEDFTVEAVLSGKTEVGKLLHEFDSNLPNNIAKIIKGTFRPLALSQIVSSQLDCDRMDYLLRDSLMTGAKYGIYDVEWIIKSLEIDEANDRLYVSARGLYAAEDYLQARYYMYRQVYFHRTLRAAEMVLRSLLQRAVDLYKSQKEIWCAKGTGFEKFLRGEMLELHEHLSIDDSDLLFHIKQWQKSGDTILSDLATRFLDRHLFKVFDLDMPNDQRANFLARAKLEVETAGFDAKYYFVEDETSEVPYHFYSKEGVEPKNQIFVEDGFSRPVVREISEVSAAVRGLQTAYQIHRVGFPPEVKDQVLTLYRKTD